MVDEQVKDETPANDTPAPSDQGDGGGNADQPEPAAGEEGSDT